MAWRTKSYGFDVSKAVPASSLREFIVNNLGLAFSHSPAWTISQQITSNSNITTIKLNPTDCNASRETYWISFTPIPPSSGITSARDENFRPFALSEAKKFLPDVELWSSDELAERDGCQLTFQPPMQNSTKVIALCTVMQQIAVAVFGAGDSGLIPAREPILAQIFWSLRPTQIQQQQTPQITSIIGTWAKFSPPQPGFGGNLKTVLTITQDGRMVLTEGSSRSAFWSVDSNSLDVLSMVFDDDRSNPRQIRWRTFTDLQGNIVLETLDNQASTPISWMRI